MVKKSKLRFLFILGFLFLISSAAVAYPFVSNYFSELRQSKVVTNYDTAVAALEDADGAAALEAARAYNAALANGQVDGLHDYDTLLNPTGNGMMGVVTIPAIDVELPIYHGTQSLELGALHLQGTSLPVGGASTHCVISAHSGMSSEILFTDLEQLAIGDRFYLTVYGERLGYEVDQILTVLPEDIEPLLIVPNEDYCTLLTCTPYGVNTHRLLVRGRRIELTEAVQPTETEPRASTWIQEYRRGILCGVGIAVILGIVAACIVLIHKRRKKH